MAYNRLTSFRKIFLNTLWPSYRGKRASRLVRERERVSIKQIVIVSTPKVSIQITPVPKDAKRKGSPTAHVPSLFISNVMRLGFQSG